MKHITAMKLAASHQLCDAEDRSTEYMIQFMQDTCKVDHDCVMNYLMFSDEKKKSLRDDVNSFLEYFEQYA